MKLQKLMEKSEHWHLVSVENQPKSQVCIHYMLKGNVGRILVSFDFSVFSHKCFAIF
jgi:hypothetical protein